MADLLRDVDGLPLAGEPGQNLDQPPQKTVPRHKQEVEKHHGREQSARKASRVGEDARQDRSAVERPGRASLRPGRAKIVGRRQKCLERIDRGFEKAQPLHDAGNALGQFGDPRLGGPGDRGANSDDRREHDKNEHNRSQHSGHTQSFEGAQGGLHQEIEHDREDHRQDDFARDIGGCQRCKNKYSAEKECLRIGRQRHIRQ